MSAALLAELRAKAHVAVPSKKQREALGLLNEEESPDGHAPRFDVRRCTDQLDWYVACECECGWFAVAIDAPAMQGRRAEHAKEAA